MSTVYLGTIDAGGNGKDILLAAINARLSTSYTLADFAFGDPSPVTVGTPTHNTQIAFGPQLHAGYYGVRTIYYNRMHASVLGTIIVPYAGEMYVSGVLNKINQKYGVFIEPADINDAVIPSPGAGVNQVTVTLDFKPECVLFYGGVEIQIGQNDPTGDTVPTTAFSPYRSFVFNQTQDFVFGADPSVILEPFSLSIDQDYVRQEVGLVSRAVFASNTASPARSRLPLATFESLGQNMPFVGMWRGDDGTLFGVSVLGDVYQSSYAADTWTLIGNGLGYDTTKADVVNAGYASPYVKAVSQNESGVVYFLGKAAGQSPKVFTSQTSNTAWTPLSLVPGKCKVLSVTAWDELEILDAVHTGTKFHVLVKSPEIYVAQTGKGTLAPAVEVLDTSSNVCDYFPLGETAARYSGITFDTTSTQSRWAIMTPVPGAPKVSVVALLPTTKNDTTHAVMYSNQITAEYTASILPHSFIGTNDEVRKGMQVSAYQVPLALTGASLSGTNTPGALLECVEIVTPVEFSDFNRYFLRTGTRTETQFLSYGVKALTSVSVPGTGRSPWKETAVALTNSQPPTPVALQCKGTRDHMLFQNGVAVHRLRYRYDTPTAAFLAEVDSSIVLEHHSGFDKVCRIGAGVHIPVVVVEAPATLVPITAAVDAEATSDDINFSFIAKDGVGYHWLTAVDSASGLSPREPSATYAFMGKTPALVTAEQDTLYYWSPVGSGVYISTNKGKSFQEHNAAPSFYQQERPASAAQSIIGSSSLAIRPEHFVESTTVNGVLIAQVNYTGAVKLFDVNTQNVAADVTLQDQLLYRIADSSTGNHYVNSAEQLGYGLNALSSFSPRKVAGWDTDLLNNEQAFGYYTSDPAVPYGVKYQFDAFTFGIAGELVDFSRDIRYLNSHQFVLMNDAGIYYLHFTDVVEPKKTVGLWGSDNTALTSFKPEVSHHLWDYADDGVGYIPYVFYGDSRVLLLERVDNNGDSAETLHVLNIPNDNGTGLVPIPMHTANRRDYYYAQKGNAIFKLTYTYDVVNFTSSVGLEQVFTLNLPSLVNMNIISGALLGVTARNSPQEVTLPDNIPAGTYIGWYCDGTTRQDRTADGSGGWIDVPTVRSFDCGYVEPAQAGDGTGVGGGTP